jgi:para-nitrobenzyl esterase
MVDKAGDLANATGGCTYDGSGGTCTAIEGGYAYHSCSVPLRISGTIPRSEYNCPGQPVDWPTEWVSPDEGNPPVLNLVPGVYRREVAYFTNRKNEAGESTGAGDNFPLGAQGWESEVIVPDHYRTWAEESIRMQNEGICQFVPHLRNTSWIEAVIWEEGQIETIHNIQYGAASLYSQDPNVNIQEEVPLYLDAYLPPDVTADGILHPAAVLVHGGGFNFGTKSDPGYVQLAKLLARRGFVVVSIDYRQMRDPNLPTDANGMPLHDISREGEVPQRSASEDARAAVRYINSRADDWGVNTSKILIAGGSSGAVTTNYLSYVEVAEDEGGSGNPDFAPSRVALCISISGGLFDGVYRVDDIGADGKDHPPLLMIHNDPDDGGQPLERALEMYDRARETRIASHLITIPTPGHVDWEVIFNDERILEETWEFIVVALDLGVGIMTPSGETAGDNDTTRLVYIAVGSAAGVGVLLAGLAYKRYSVSQDQLLHSLVVEEGLSEKCLGLPARITTANPTEYCKIASV